MLYVALAALEKHSTYLEIPDKQAFHDAILKIRGIAQKQQFVDAINRIASEMEILHNIPEKIMYQNTHPPSRVCALVDHVREVARVIGQGRVIKDFENSLIKEVTNELCRMQELVYALVRSEKVKQKMQMVKEFMKEKKMEDRLCEEKEAVVFGCAVRAKMAIEQMDGRFGGFSLFTEPDAKRRFEAFTDGRWSQHTAVCKLVRYCNEIGELLARLFVSTSRQEKKELQTKISSLPMFSIQ